ncbi:MAG: threonine/homoserine/homoserine lactone efflux protein [Paracoccaceae bacterium]|jgi:threonine/homoserine/homoserine lactone efflux protein
MLETFLAFDPAVLAAFVAAGLVLNFTPGVDFVFVSANGIAGGPRAGMAAALGINLGVALHILLAAAGLSTLLLACPGAYDAIRYAGAAYLAYLAVQAWRSDTNLGKGTALPPRTAIWRGFLTNILNPKVALFVLAFIPQFTNPNYGPLWQQMLILGAIFQAFGLAFSMTLGATAGLFATALKRRAGALNKITSILFGGLAARLIID